MKRFYVLQQNVSNLLWKLCFKVQAGIGTAVVLLVPVMDVQAKGKDNATDYSFLTNGNLKNDSIDGVTDQIKGVGASTYRLVAAVGVISFFIFGAMAAIRIIANKNGQKREETKDWISYILLGVAGLCGIATIYSAIQAFVGGLA